MKLGEKIVKHRKTILIVAVLLIIPAIIGIKATRINYDMLTYLPDDMETVKGQNLLQKDFGKGGFSIIVVENMKTGDVSDLKKKISKVKNVDSVLNLEDAINPSVPVDMYPSLVKNNFKKQDASMIVVFFKTSTSEEKTLTAITEIRKLSTKQTYVSGMSALVTDLKALCEAEEPKYVAIAVVLSLLIMMILLDSYAAPFLFMLSIGMAILYNLGSNVFFGEISYITKAIAAILQLAVTMDYSIFLWHSYGEALSEEPDRYKAMATAVDKTMVSITGSSITTIAGFLALCFMSYTMGMDLGLVMAKGVALGVISSVTILPALLLASSKLLNKTVHKEIVPNMDKFAHRLTGKYGIYIAIFVVLLFPAIHGYNNENVIYDFTKMLSSSSNQISEERVPFKTANDKLESDFGIGTTHMIIANNNLPAKDGRAMSKELENIDGVSNVLGYDALMSPDILRSMLPSEVTSALSAKNHQLIMVNSAYKVSTTKCNNQITEINKVVDKYDKSAKVIGEGPATKDLIKITDKDFKVVSFISIAAVFIIILFVLKSGSLPVLLVAVIEFAIYMNLGIPGYTGLELPFIVPVCISTIQLGSTVDYAILMSTRYKVERMAGLKKRNAIEVATSTSIPSILVSALGFFTATFGVGLYSDIGIISTLCNLMARGAIISMLTVILVLPSFLMAFDKVICKTTIGMKDIYKKEKMAKAAV